MTSGRQALQRVLGICPGSVSTPSTSTGSVLWAECSAGLCQSEGGGWGILEVVLAQPGPQPSLVPVPLNEEGGAQR